MVKQNTGAGIIGIILIILLIGSLLYFGGGKSKSLSIAGSSCESEPLIVNDQQAADLNALQTQLGHTFTTDELSQLGITQCDGGLCTITCDAEAP